MPGPVISWSRQNWFYLLLPLWAFIAFQFQSEFPWSDKPALGEGISLFDWCIFVPATFAICYRRIPPKALAIRIVGLFCGGIWLAGLIIPDPAEHLVKQLGWTRSLGLAVVMLFEIGAFLALMRMLFGGTPDPAELERQGVPPVIARIMLAEARFWRWVFSRLRG